MKKLLVVLLALTCAGALAFADGAAPSMAINGFVDTGVAVTLPGASGAANMIQQYNNDSGNAGRFRLGIAITAPDGTFGFISRMEGDSGLVGNKGGNSAEGNFGIGFNRFLGWANVFNGMLTLKAGMLDELGFMTANKNWGAFLDGAVGIEAIVKPMSGIAISYYLPGYLAGAGFNSYAGNGQLMDVLSGSSIQASVSMPNLVNIVAGFQGRIAQ